jgi:fumarate reductase subunit D
MSLTYRKGSNGAGTVIAIVADVLAIILGLWILMYLLDANRGNDLVQFVHNTANWLASWSYDLFTFHKAWARVVCGYGLAAVVYLFIGHAIAGRVHRH